MKSVHKQVKISSLKNANYNPPTRTDEANLKSLCESMARVGFVVLPILIKNNIIIEGHRRVAAAKLLGWTVIDAIILSGDFDEHELFAEINQTTRKMNGREILHVWLNSPTSVSQRDAKKFQRMSDEIGRPLMKKICDAGMSWRIISDSKKIADYANCAGGATQVIGWLLKHPVYGVCLRAMANKQSPYVILQAITEDKPIALSLAIV